MYVMIYVYTKNNKRKNKISHHAMAEGDLKWVWLFLVECRWRIAALLSTTSISASLKAHYDSEPPVWALGMLRSLLMSPGPGQLGGNLGRLKWFFLSPVSGQLGVLNARRANCSLGAMFLWLCTDYTLNQNKPSLVTVSNTVPDRVV